MGENIGDKSVVIEARTDIRLLATLQKYFEESGVKPQTKAELVKLSLELAYAFMLQLKKVNRYESLSFTEANEILSIYGSLHKGNQNRSKLHALIAAEARISELLSPTKAQAQQQILSDPRLSNLEATFEAKLSEEAMTLEQWMTLSTEIQQLVREKEPHLVPEGV